MNVRSCISEILEGVFEATGCHYRVSAFGIKVVNNDHVGFVEHMNLTLEPRDPDYEIQTCPTPEM